MIDPARFWRHVHRKLRGCWIWKGHTNDLGYGRVRVQGALRSAHRIAYQLEYGPISGDAVVRQRCGERACCRPDHLVLVEVVRLTKAQTQAIQESRLGCRRLARTYRVSRQRVLQIKSSQSATYGK